jgi:hypothetical protein
VNELSEEEINAVGERVHGFAGRLDGLPPVERRILGLAASLGEQFNRELLRHLADATIGWDDHAFERLILGGFISVATPTVRLSMREPDGRVCYAFTHTLLWKAAADIDADSLPSPIELAERVVRLVTDGSGELYGVAPLEGLDVTALDDAQLDALFGWLATMGRRLSPIFAETYLSLCRLTLEPCRALRAERKLGVELRPNYLAALSAYAERLYLTGGRDELHEVASEIAGILDAITDPPQTPERRIIRLECAVAIWHDADLRGDPEDARKYFDQLLEYLPTPAEQTDRELRGSAEAIRLLASHAFSRGDFAESLDLVLPYVAEMDRMGPVTMNAFFRVLLPAMLRTGRERELQELLEAAMTLRHEADPFTRYELLMQAVNYAKHVHDLANMRLYATEARELIDRYPSYRNQGTKFWHLPWVAVHAGDQDELDKLEREFRAQPPPSRSPAIQIVITLYQFQLAWNLLGNPERSLAFAEEIEPQIDVLPPFLQLNYLWGILSARIDARQVDCIEELQQRIDSLLAELKDDYVIPGTVAERRATMLRLLANAVRQEEPDELREAMYHRMRRYVPRGQNPARSSRTHQGSQA